MNDSENTPEKRHKPFPKVAACDLDGAENFDPYNCGKEDGIGRWGAAILIFKGCIGCSFLLMPYLMKNLGYVTGTIVVTFSGIVYFYTIHSLLSTKHELSKEVKMTRLSYVEVAEKTFQRSPYPINKLHSSVRYLMYLYYSFPANDAAYLIVIASEIQTLAKRFDFNINIKHIVSVEIIPLTAFCLIPNILEILVPYSGATNILTLLMAIGTIACSVLQRKASVPLQAFTNAYSIPEGIAWCINAYCCTGIILPIENEMRRPRKMVSAFGSLNVATAAVITFYYSFGIILYVNYGDEVQENILFNLPADNYITDGIKLLYATSLFVTYILIFFGRFDNVWSASFKDSFAGSKYEFVVEYGIRLGINMIAYLLAVAVPNVSIILALSGTVSFIIEVALLAVLELLLAISQRKNSSWIIWKNLTIITGSLALFCMNMTFCIKEIIAMYY